MSEPESERLWEVYEERCAFAGVPIQDFVQKLQAGDFGEFSTDAMVDLLEKLLNAVLENIDLMADSNPGLADQAEERKEQQGEFYRGLIDQIRTAAES